MVSTKLAIHFIKCLSYEIHLLPFYDYFEFIM